MKVLKFVFLAAFVWGPALSDCCAVQDGAGPSADSLWIPTLSDASGRHPGSPPPVPDLSEDPECKPYDAQFSEELLGTQTTGEPFAPNESLFNEVSPYAIQTPDLHSEMPLQSMTNPTSQLPPVFVHERRTIRASERTAEIWVKLPKDSKSSVSVNFVEYPPEGDFRIFKTKMMTKETRLFYLSAKSWDPAKKRWIDLHWDPSLSTGGKPTFDYGNEKSGRLEIIVELQHGQRKIVQFVKPEAFGNAKVDNVSLDSLDETLQKHIKPLNEQLNKVQADVENQIPQFDETLRKHVTPLNEQLNKVQTDLENQMPRFDETSKKHVTPLNEQLNKLKTDVENQVPRFDEMKIMLEDIRTLTNDIATRVSKLEQADDPEIQSDKVTAQFLFSDVALKIAGHRVTVNGEFKSIDWIRHPVSVVIAVPKSLAALPVRPFNAEVTFFLQERDGEPFATLDPIAVQFSDLGNHVVAEIPFKQRLAVPMSDSLVRWNKAAATYRVGAIIIYEIELDKLDSVRVCGPMGNKMEMTIAP